MKILQVTPFFSPVHGGSAEVPYQLSRQMIRRGHDVTIYTSDAGGNESIQEYLKSIPQAKVRCFKTWLSCAKFYITPAIVNAAKTEVAQFDVVHLHNYRTFQNMIVPHYARKHGVPYVLQAHGSLTTYFQKRGLKRAFDAVAGGRILRHASAAIAVTGAEAGQYRSMGVSEGKIRVIPHGIDLGEYDNLPQRGEFRKKFEVPDDRKIVLFLGRIDNTKGLDLLISTFAELQKELPDVRLVIAGPDHGFLKVVKRLGRELKIEEKVLLTGPLYGPEKLAAYVDADVFVLPSSYEIFGITILEACACGTPMIVTDRCGLADAINGAGLVVSYDKANLFDALRRMLSDDRIRRESGEKGKLLVRERFSWEKIAEQVEAVYTGVRRG